MNHYVVTVAIFGFVVLLTVWLPMALRKLPLSLPICCVVLGMILAWSPFTPLPGINPLENRATTEHLTEFVIIVALMGAGLKIDRPFQWRRWMVPWRLLGIAMPLSIAAIAVAGWGILGLGASSALLLGASLAPTDPVLAADVQVGPPQTGQEDEIRFALTSEAGLNDGLSFPFVLAAIAMASHPMDFSWIGSWLLVDVIWRLTAAIGMGWLSGRLLGYLTFRLSEETALAKTGDGLVALGFTCIAYGLTELIHGYGFLAVFITALTLRTVERKSAFHRELHDFGEQIERLLMMVLLVCLGSVVAEGTLISNVDWRVAAVAAVTLIVIRPVASWISLAGLKIPSSERAIISVFGIRGLGSIYYLAYAIGKVEFDGSKTVWATVIVIILVSILVHGMAVTPVMRWVDRSRGLGDGGLPIKENQAASIDSDPQPAHP